MSGPGISNPGQSSEGSDMHQGDFHLPRDVWSIVLAKAAAPLRQLENEKGRSHVARWLDLALVCKQWHDMMLLLPVSLRLDDGSMHSMDGRMTPAIATYQGAVAAVHGLAASRVPIRRLDMPIKDQDLPDIDFDGEEANDVGELSAAMRRLFVSPNFRAVSGPHLVAVRYNFGFVFDAPPEAFPNLHYLFYVRTRLAHALPPSLQYLGIQGILHVTFGSGFIATREVGVRADDIIAYLAPLHRLRHLRLMGCRFSEATAAALPPSLTLLRLYQCHMVAAEADFPPQLVRTSNEVDHAGLFTGSFELAAGLVITDPGHQLAPAAPPSPAAPPA